MTDYGMGLLARLGAVSVATGGLTGVFALEHLQTVAAYGPLCGGGELHCPACPASLLLLGAGAAMLAARAALRRPVLVRA